MTNNGTIDKVNVTLTQAPGASEIDLVNATTNWIGSSGTYTLVHDTAGDGSEWTFKTYAVKDTDGDSTVLNDADDRHNIDFILEGTGASELTEGNEATIKINTMAGATTEIRFTVPKSLGQKNAVEL